MAKISEIIEPSSTWDIVDSSKLRTYMDCPRKFFYEYVLGWRYEAPNNHLVFGTAWHAAVESLLLNDYSKESVANAGLLFMKYYRAELPPSTDELYAPKRPIDALSALVSYAKRFKSDDKLYEFPHTEVGGVVLINKDSPMHFKIDAIARVRSTGKYLIMDHKTSQRKSSKWSSGWQLSTQLLLYMHVLYCLYSPEEVQGARVRGSFFYKNSRHGFDEAVIDKTSPQMQAWINSCNKWYDDLKNDMDILLWEDNDEELVMRSFPQNDQACTKYFGCPYLDFCNAWPNPLTRCESPPIGFRVEHWDPTKIETIKENINLTQLKG